MPHSLARLSAAESSHRDLSSAVFITNIAESDFWYTQEGPTRMLREPFAYLRMLVSGIVVDDRMDGLSLGNLRVDLIEEADELLMSMVLHVAADDGAIENIERGEQCGGAVALVIVRHRPGATRLHRQPRLGAVEGLDLALLVDREDDRVGGRVDIETDHILELLGEPRIVRQLERSDTVRCKLVGLQNALHRPQADPDRLCEHPSGPMSGRSRRWPGHEVDDLPDDSGRERRLARRAPLFAPPPINTFDHEPCLPGPHHRLRLARSPHDLGGAPAPRGGEDDLNAPHMLLRCAAIRDDRLKSTAVRSGDVDDNSCSHDESLNRFGRFVNRPNESDH